MKNIVFVIESLHCGGAEKSLVTLLQNIDYKNYNLDLFLVIEGGEFQKFVPKEINIKKIKTANNPNDQNLTKRLKYRVSRFLNKKYHPAQFFWKFHRHNYKKIDKTYDIAIAYNQGFSTYFVSENIKANKKIAWMNTDYNKAGYNINFDFKFYNNFDEVVCVSNENKKSLELALQTIDQSLPINIIQDISDEGIIQKQSLLSTPFQNTEGVKNILTIGRLASAKGLHLAIEACSLLLKSNHNIKWYVIGEGPERKKLEKHIERKNLQDHFILLGYKENPYPYLKSCDIYAQTSIFEGLGLSVIEATILNKPIVTTNFETASTIIEHKETGLICEMVPAEIAKSIAYFITNSDFVKKTTYNLSIRKNESTKTSLKKINKILNT
ncbi:glycosyltransferase [Tamlana sp. 2_MG-2023]|uniref:glycosyltransferase n=1 Tax=unclassified Tamlana TaxID=2614803 RepID=UPI0026E4458E|nr:MULTISPECIES: glycosyltransferase [unclassified Tamlana]MDO6759419.1 glycosyltransferase [Tamlana sp. 2_MG-2023]MDO6790442.1 glycosyltransferase [Tamlana sp. 1_MG-2023]